MQRLKKRWNRGFTYVELIVVLSIFTMVTSVVVFDYSRFQSKVDIKNLANDIAIKLVEAQKSALSGKWNTSAGSSWKPSYGVYFDISAANGNAGNKVFYHFADTTVNELFNYGTYTCPASECLEKFNIAKGNYISRMDVYYTNGTSTQVLNDLHITYTRPNSGASIKSQGTTLSSNISYAEITVIAPKGGMTAKVKAYASGRIQIN